MKFIEETLAALEGARQRSDSVLVGYSGGKDSLAVLDLCTRVFPKVQPFMMEFVPGLSLMDGIVDYARQRWKLETLRYLHWSAIQAMAAGVYCELNWTHDIPKISVNTVYDLVRSETGIPLIATGHKRSDSQSRRQLMQFSEDENLLWPIAGWRKEHVLAYLRLRDIPRPKAAKGATTGVGLRVNSLLWLHDNHREDFEKLCKIFKYAPAVVWRRTFYGIPRRDDEGRGRIRAGRASTRTRKVASDAA